MDYLYLYIIGGVIVVLLIVIVVLLSIRTKSSTYSRQSFNLDKKEDRRRRKVSNQISQEIKTQFEIQRKKLVELRNKLENEYGSVGKTEVNITRLSHPNYHSELIRLFDLNKDEDILYCRRYEKLFGSDTFFIITEYGIGYAPRREVFPFVGFGEIKEFNAYSGNAYVEIKDIYGESGYVETEDFTYDGSHVKLAKILNDFLTGYKTPFDIYFEACGEALDQKATPILPSLIENISEINRNWANFFRANYKFILCEDGIDVKDNSREASYDIENILRLAEEKDKDENVINSCLVLKAKIMLLNNEDHTEIKKLIDTVLGSKCDQFVLEEANNVRRKLVL